MGAALATLITLGFIALIRGFQNWKLLNFFPFSWKLIKPICAGIIAGGSGYYLKIFIMPYHTVLTLLCAGFVIFVVFFTVLWLFGLDEDDNGLLAGLRIILNNFKSIPISVKK